MRRIIHRDLKPANILLDSDDFVSICDFGEVKAYGSDLNNLSHITKTAYKGTEAYWSPEAYLDKQFDYKNDVWAMGLCMYELVTQQYPFTGQHDRRRLINADYDDIPLQRVDERLRELIGSCIQVDPEKRPSANEAQLIL